MYHYRVFLNGSIPRYAGFLAVSVPTHSPQDETVPSRDQPVLNKPHLEGEPKSQRWSSGTAAMLQVWPCPGRDFCQETGLFLKQHCL